MTRMAISFVDGDHEFIEDYRGFFGMIPRIGEKVAVIPTKGGAPDRAYYLHTVVDVRYYPGKIGGLPDMLRDSRPAEVHLLVSMRP